MMRVKDGFSNRKLDKRLWATKEITEFEIVEMEHFWVML